jgi:hypothetical protein
VANTQDLFGNGGVGFIGWLDGLARKNMPTFLCDMLSQLIYYSIGGWKFTCLLAA